jgi:hypothetical protein
LVFDESNSRLIGLVGLSDPVYALGSRDGWIGWDAAVKREGLRKVMDAFVLGAVPPYNQLLAGKLMALLVTSAEVQRAYGERYAGAPGRISGSRNESPLALVTTTSALGRSSVYNRLRIDGRTVAKSVGYTTGSGDFQFANGLYDSLAAYAHLHCAATAKHVKWGTGFRNRREVVKKALIHLGLGEALLYHGVRREVFVFPMGANTREALLGESDLEPFGRSAEELADYWRTRWLLPRAARTPGFGEFERDSWRLWPRET